MDFLFKDRGSGKRTIKPSKDSENLDALIQDHESDDSDFEVEKHKKDNGHHDSDSGAESDVNSGDSDNDDSEDSDSDDEGDGDIEDEEESLRRRANLTTEELVSMARCRPKGSQDGGPGGHKEVKVCGTCLGEKSDHSNEIVECDGCGVMVHEVCYGIQEVGSVSSNVSAASTEPWFCEPCMAGVNQPHCEACPAIGGIYKETDVGKWIHLVCALYIPQISFFDQVRITRATLFELNYQSWGKRACCLCRNIKLARTGLCIECDAGMCRQYFHVTCAQEAGLLSEPSEDDSDSFFGHCRAHTDKDVGRRRRRNWLSHQLHYRQKGAALATQRETEISEVESASQRIRRKLKRVRERWVSAQESESWVPTQKMPRLLLTSSKAVGKLQRKNSLHGWNTAAMEEEEHNKQVVSDIRRRWNVQPAFNVEYTAYYHDRNTRIKELQESLAENVLANSQLSSLDSEVVVNYHELNQELDEQKELAEELKRKVSQFKDLLVQCDPKGRTLGEGRMVFSRVETVLSPEPAALQQVPSRSPTRAKGRRSRGTNQGMKRAVGGEQEGRLCLHQCDLCKTDKDQHLLANCDTCKLYYHLGCLTPPLSKMPKKTKQYGWQCCECDKEPEVNPLSYTPMIDTSAPRSSRHRGSTSTAKSKTGVDDSDLETSPTLTVRPPSKKAPSSPIKKAPSPPTKNQISDPPGPPIPSPRGRKRGRVSVGLSKEADTSTDQTTEVLSTPEVLSPPVKSSRRGRKPKATDLAPRPVEAEVPAPPLPDPPSDKSSESPVSSPEPVTSSSLPPKKLFKSKATLKETVSALDTPNSSIDSAGFKNWLDAKLSPTKPLSNGHSPSIATEDPLAQEDHVSQVFQEDPVIAEEAMDNFSIEDTLENPSNEDVEDTPPPLPKPKLSLESTGGVNGDASEESSGEEGTPEKLDPFTSYPSLVENGEVGKILARQVAKRERKRQKREEKEKRREERRKKKLLKTQDAPTWSTSIKIIEDIEEDDDCCVVRIAPKPIKIKIKTSTSSRPLDFAILAKKQVEEDTPSSLEDTPSSLEDTPSSLPRQTQEPQVQAIHMHPKKKIAHMDYSLGELGFGYSYIAPAPQSSQDQTTNSSTATSSVSSSLCTTPTLNNSPAVTTISLRPTSTTPSNPVHSNGLAGDGTDDVESLEGSPRGGMGSPPPDVELKSPPTTSPPLKERPQRGQAPPVRRGRDARTQCDVCRGEGNNANLVRCDECQKCYHFGCLNPPVKKTPKVSGWSWSCSDCAPSDTEDARAWHL